MTRQTVTLTIEIPDDLVEILAKHGDDLLSVLERVVREASRISASGEIAAIRRRIAARSDARRTFIVDLGRRAHRLYRARLKRRPERLTNSEQNEWRSQMSAEIASELGHPGELVDVAIRQHRHQMKSRIHSRRLLYAVRAVVNGEDRKGIAQRFRVNPSTIRALIAEAQEHALVKGVSLEEYAEILTAERQAEIRAICAEISAEPDIDLRAVQVTQGSDR